MEVLGWSIAGLFALITLISLRQYHAGKNTYRPLSSRQPEPAFKPDERELGTEALDLKAVARVNRRNESLERGHVNWTRRSAGFLRPGSQRTALDADTDIDPWDDNEKYAARFHAAFQKGKTKDT